MPDWWSYSLSDFLLFSPRTYYRLIERHNLAEWPAHAATLVLGLLILALLSRPSAVQGKVISSVLAVLWCWVAASFLWKRYATINWAVVYVLPIFAVEAVLLLWTGSARRQLTFRADRGAAGMVGLILFLLSLAAYPGVAPLVGRTWRQAEVFGIAPDPTVIGTAGVLLLAEGRTRWRLLAVPLLWCVISGLTLFAMGSPEAILVGMAATAIALAGSYKHRELSWLRNS